MEFELLGDLTVRNGSGLALAIAGARPRALLALLLLHAPSAVSTGRILDELWTGARAKDPMAALHTTVAKLRRALQPHAPGLVVTGPAGYRLDLTGHTLDARLLDGELARARATEDPGRRAALLRAALDRWSGTPLAGLPALPFVQAERARLEALRLTVLEERADAELAAHDAAGGPAGGAAGGADPADLVEALRAAARADPDRERLHALLIRTLQACGRQAEALGVYRAARADLRERLGIEPGPEMRAAQQAVLRGFSGTGSGTGTGTGTGSATATGNGTATGTVRHRRAHGADPGARPGPAPGTDFVGRGPELAAIAAQLAEARLVTVTGTAGIGKTRLSLAAAAREQEAGATVWRVDLVPCSPADVPGAVAAALGIAPGPAETLADRMRLAVDRAPRCLLLLDNCEHLTEAAADLTARLLDDCPRLRVLATSREGLGVAGESRLALRPLTGQDAVRLFLDRLSRVSPPAARAAGWDEVRDLCEAVDRLPLGIELVAPKAASTPLPVIVRQLRTRRGLLEVPLRSADARHGTLRAALDWSYRLITDEEREVWRAVSVFAAPFTVDAAEAVAGPGAGDTLALLAEKSLLVYDPGPGSPRYRMLVSLRQYARQALAECGEETGALRRHADWVAALAQRTDAALRTGSGPAAFAEMTAVTPEVACCLDWLQDSDDPGDRLLGSRIATHLSLYWMAAGQRQEGHRRLLRALESTPPTADWYAETLAWCGWLGVNIRRAGDDDELLRQAVPAAERRGDPAAVTLVGALALTVHVRQERLAEAREVARRTASALDEHGHRWETGVWQLFHSELLVAEDERRAALTSAMTARELLTTLDPHSAATAQIMTGMAYERLGERALSVRAFRAAHDELRLIGAEHEAAYVKAVLACAAAGDGEWDDATSFADALETYARESAEGYLLAKVETVRALAARARGDLDQAERLHLRASERYQNGNRPECAAHDLTMLGVVAAERGEAVLAQVRWEHALRTARMSGRRYAEALPLRGLLALREGQGDDTAAAELRDRLERTVREASPSRTTECPFHLAVSTVACDETARALTRVVSGALANGGESVVRGVRRWRPWGKHNKGRATAMDWHRELLIGFDLETTGTDPSTARIVTAAVVEVRGGEPIGRHEWLAAPEVPIPDDAVAVHGITNERAAAGRPIREVADEIADVLVAHWRAGAPVVAYNAAFDLSLLAAELDRHGLRSLSERLGGEPTGPVVDPYTIDRAVDRYRKGKRTLEAVCGEYGVAHERAHEAGADALAAVRVACALAERHREVAGLELWDLHHKQVGWYAHWAADFQSWLRRKGTPDAVVDSSWPLREARAAVG